MTTSAPLPSSPPGAADAPAPPLLARIAEDRNVDKARLDLASLFALALLGGAFIAIGGMFSTVVGAGAQGQVAFGLARLAVGVSFALGLILISVGGGQLFTGDCLMVMGRASGRLRWGDMMRVWTTVWAGNFAGALGLAALVTAAGGYKFGAGAVGANALAIAQAKAALPVDEAFFLAILCNMLVCLAVWLSYAARSVADKALAIVFPIAAFVAAGFEHCVANMYFIPVGLFVKRLAPTSFWTQIGREADAVSIPVDQFLVNIAAVTLGNWVGGAVLVGALYWFAYRRARSAEAAATVEAGAACPPSLCQPR